MAEQLTQHNYLIQNATLEDVVGIGVAHFESTREAYPNERAGITVEWIDETWSFLKEEKGDEHRRGTVTKSEADPDHNLYLDAKDAEGKIVGFIHARKTDDEAKLEGLYLLKEAQGTGLADDLMVLAIDFAGALPMQLEVADYNDRAIAFYERYGFEIFPGKRGIIKEKLRNGLELVRTFTNKKQFLTNELRMPPGSWQARRLSAHRCF